MPIHFHCSQCGGEFVAPDQLAGKKARCGRCQTINQVPLADAPVQAALAAPGPSPFGAGNVQGTFPGTAGGARSPLTGAGAPFAGAPLASDPFAALPADPFAASAASPLKPLPNAYQPSGGGGGKTLLLILGGIGAVGVLGVLLLCGGFALLGRSRRPTPVVANPPINFRPGPYIPPAPVPRPGTPITNTTPSEPTPAVQVRPPLTWSVKPDPPAKPAAAYSTPLEAKLEFSADVLLPRDHSPHIAIRSSNGQSLSLLNLETGQPGVTVNLEGGPRLRDHKGGELSPDGRWFVGALSGNFSALEIGVWSVEGKPLRTIRHEGGRFHNGTIRMAGTDHVLAVYEDPQQSAAFAWWNAETGDLVGTFSDPFVKYRDLDDHSLQVSPGGQYVAAMTKQGRDIYFWSLESKAPAGKLAFPADGSNWPGLAFSPDGTMFAAIDKFNQEYHVVVADLASGSAKIDSRQTTSLDGNPYWNEGQRIEWSQDQKYLVHAGTDLIDAATGAKVARIKYSDESGGRPALRIVGPDQVLRLARVSGDQQCRISSLKQGWLPAANNPLATSRPAPAGSSAGSGATGTSIPNTGGAPADSGSALVWSARPDPPTAPVEYKKGKTSIPLPNSAELRVPEGPSHFVLAFARDGQREAWQVFDLRTGKEIGKPLAQKLEIDYRSEAFSPDGRYLAAALRGGFGQEKKKIGVWSFATGQLHRELEIKGNRLSGPIRFGAPHQVLAITEPDWNLSLLTLWDLQTGETKLEIPFASATGQEKLRPESLAVSPGGKYAVVVIGKFLGVIDLATGKPAGRVPLSEEPSSCEGVAFSPDGSEVAALFTMGAGHRLVSLDFATGQVRLDHDYRGRLDHFGYDGPVLDWIPDGSGLLYRGHLLLERTTGEEVWVLPNTDSSPRRMTRPGEVLVLLRDRKGKALQTAELNTKEIAAAMESVKAGGSAVDSVLPPITTADLFSATAATLPNGGVQWNYQPDAAGSTPKGQDKEILIAKGGETVRRVMFAGAAAGKIVVQKEITPKAGPGRRPQRQVVIERFDLVSGSKGNTLDVPNVYQLADVSPSGQHALVAFAPEANKVDRLDVLLLSPKKHIAGFRPYAGEKEKPAETGRPRPWMYGVQNDPRLVTWAALIDDEHVLTVNSAGKLACWKLPECKAVYYFEDFGMPVALSAGKQVLLGAHNGEYRLFRSKTGECLGDLEAPTLGAAALRGAFRQDGAELAAIVDAGPDRMLVRWDLASGKRKDEFPVPAAVAPAWFAFHYSHSGIRQGLEYRGKDYLMVDDAYLVNLPNQATVWKYHLPGGFYAANSPDHLTWYCVRRQGATDNSLFLTSFETPALTTKGKLANVTLKKQLVLSPGDSVKVHIDLAGVGMSDLTDTVQKSVVQALELRGMKIDPGAGYQFSLVAAERSTGKEIGIFEDRSPLGFNPFFSRGATPDQVIQQQEMAVRFAVSNASGKVLWHQDRATPMRNYGSVQEGDAQQQLRDEMTRNFQGLLASSGTATQSLPRYLFGDLSKILAGESSLGFRTEEPPPTVTLPQNQQPQQQAEITIRP